MCVRVCVLDHVVFAWVFRMSACVYVTVRVHFLVALRLRCRWPRAKHMSVNSIFGRYLLLGILVIKQPKSAVLMEKNFNFSKIFDWTRI